MALEKDEQALLLLTNRLLMDWMSISVDTGTIPRATVERLIDFSAAQVTQGAPWLKAEVDGFATLTKERLPTSASPN